MYFERRQLVVENAGETVLPNTEFRERSTSQGFEKVIAE